MCSAFPAKSFRRNLFNLVLVAGAFLVISACTIQPVSRENANAAAGNDSQIAPAVTSSPAANSIGNKEKQEDKGDFIVENRGTKNFRYNDYDRKVKEDKLLEKAADTLNRALILPHDIYLRTKDCGEANAHYDSADHSITVCYELMEHFYKLFRSDGSSEDEADKKTFDATRFAFLHELGHALIDAYNLPITGNEEDAADRCSSYICLAEMGDDGIRAVLAAADAFHIEARTQSTSRKDYSSEHLLQEQRFYNTLCLIYGSDTNKYGYFVSRKYLPAPRAARCQNEYERMVQSWNILLQNWRKD